MQAHLFLTVPHFTEKNVIVEMSKFRCELSEGGTSCGLLDFFPFHLCLSVCDDCREQKHQSITFVLIISAVRYQTKVHNCKCSYLLLYFIVLLSKILLLIEFCFIISLIFLIYSPCPKYTSLGVRWCVWVFYNCDTKVYNVQHKVVPIAYLSLENWANRVTIISKPMVKDIYYIRIKCDRPSSV